MKKIIPFIILLSSLFSVTIQAQLTGRKIAHIDGNHFVFEADTLELKQSLEKIINMKAVKLDRIEIRKDVTFGDRQEDYYMLIAFDYSKSLKTVRWLANRDGSLYFTALEESDMTDDDIFYATYFTCYGTDSDCFPMVAHLSDGYGWSSSTELTCKPDSKCLGVKTVSFGE